jgi:hypothetical protein
MVGGLGLCRALFENVGAESSRGECLLPNSETVVALHLAPFESSSRHVIHSLDLINEENENCARSGRPLEDVCPGTEPYRQYSRGNHSHSDH